jgi:hypothetical protein
MPWRKLAVNNSRNETNKNAERMKQADDIGAPSKKAPSLTGTTSICVVVQSRFRLGSVYTGLHILTLRATARSALRSSCCGERQGEKAVEHNRRFPFSVFVGLP